MSSSTPPPLHLRVAGGPSVVLNGRILTGPRPISHPEGRVYNTNTYDNSLVIAGDYYGPPLQGLASDESVQHTSNRSPQNPGQPQIGGAPYPSLAHARLGAKLGFHQRWGLFRPYLIELAGTQDDPWDIPQPAILAAWSATWGEDDARLHALRVMQYAKAELAVWYVDFVEHAIQYLEHSWNENTATPDARRKWITNMFRPVDGKSDSIALYYREPFSNSARSHARGLFQSSIISSTFAIQLLVVSEIPIEKRLQTFPQAALVLAIHAATFAATIWASGVKSVDFQEDPTAIPSYRDSLVAKVDEFVRSGVERSGGAFDSAMKEIEGPPRAKPPVYGDSRARAAPGVKIGFRQQWNIFRPHLIELAGIQEDPWDISDRVFLAAWSTMWGAEDTKFHTSRITNYVIAELEMWRDEFLRFAVGYLFTSWDESTNTPDARRKWIADMLQPMEGDLGGIPLYYKTLRREGSKVRGVGLFQSSIISATLGIHILLVSQIPLEMRMRAFPKAALVMAIHSAIHAATMWAGGEQPATPSAGYTAIPSNRESIGQKVADLLNAADSQAEAVFDAALRQVQKDVE